MVYQIEFVCHIEDKATVLDRVTIVGVGDLAAVVAEAEELFRRLETLPRPDGFRIRENDSVIVHEHHEFNEKQNA